MMLKAGLSRQTFFDDKFFAIVYIKFLTAE